MKTISKKTNDILNSFNAGIFILNGCVVVDVETFEWIIENVRSYERKQLRSGLQSTDNKL